MKYEIMSQTECDNKFVGEGITLAAVMAVAGCLSSFYVW